jgi:serine/threonine-protein kinase RsbW
MPQTVYELTIESKVEEIRRVEQFIKHIGEVHRFPEPFLYNVMLVVTEAINNAVIHGNSQDQSKSAYLKCTIQQQSSKEVLMVEVTDQGSGFNMEHLPNPLAEENLLKPSGRGVFLMKQFANVDYNFSENGTTVKMTLTINR